MRATWLLANLVAVVGLGLQGCKRSALPGELSQALREGTDFELISIDPLDTKDEAAPDRLNGYLILGRTSVTNHETKGDLISSIERSTIPTEGAALACMFMPRHVVRVKYKGEVFDYLICFQCGELLINKGGEKAAYFFFDRKDKSLFNKVLTDAGVKLAPQ